MIDETDREAPALEALQNVAVLEDGLRPARNTYVEEGQKATIEVLELDKIQASALSGLREEFRCELAAFLPLLGPRQRLEQDGDLTYEISRDLPLPLRASFCPSELPISTVGKVELEDS